MKQIIIPVVFFILLTGCGQSANKMESEMVTLADEANLDLAPPTAQSREPSESRNFEVERKIIKEAWISFEVEEYADALTAIKKMVKKQNGYISQENESSTDYSKSNNLSIRIPADKFDTLVEELTSVALKVDNKNINARDVTEEFIDIEARLNTKREVEKRYLELLSEAKTITDILAVEDKLRIIREEIEAKEGRLKYLSNQVSLSTIHLNVYQKLTFEPGFKFFKKIGSALKGGWKGLLNVVIGLIYVWPLLIILTAVLIWLSRRRKRRKKA